MISRVGFWMTFSCLVMAPAAMSAAGNESAAIGVNVVNPQRLSAEDRGAILEQLQSAGVQLIRVPLAPAWGGNDYGPAIDFIGRAFERGIKVDLIIGLQYRDGADRRPPVKELPKMWPSYPLSSADSVKFRSVFEPMFNQMEELGVTFAALELGNEINWAGFNGEFPIPGEGKVFGLEDLESDPEARQIAEGYRVYLQTLRVLKEIRDHSRLNRDTPILSAGLSDPGPPGPRPGAKADAVAITATLEYLRANGMDQLVDGYGVHTYPWVKGEAAGRLNRLKTDTLAECGRALRGKPCWLTEWGFPAEGTGCPTDDASRTPLIREMLDDFREFVGNGRLQGLLYYAWASDSYGIYRCGGLTESGRLVLDRRAVQ